MKTDNKGKRIRLIKMNDPYPVDPGTDGTVEFEDDLGTTYRHDLTQFEELLLTMLLKINEGKED
jgi:hypothetical protein